MRALGSTASLNESTCAACAAACVSPGGLSFDVDCGVPYDVLLDLCPVGCCVEVEEGCEGAASEVMAGLEVVIKMVDGRRLVAAGVDDR